jgi:hypothetical protein
LSNKNAGQKAGVFVFVLYIENSSNKFRRLRRRKRASLILLAP